MQGQGLLLGIAEAGAAATVTSLADCCRAELGHRSLLSQVLKQAARGSRARSCRHVRQSPAVAILLG